MGGLRTRNKIITNNGIPYLKDIRFMYLNKLFSYEERQFRESELVVFIHPEIVTPYYGGSEREEIIGNFSNQDLDRISLPGETEFDCEYEDGDLSRARVILDETDEPAGQSARAPKRGAAAKTSVAANRAGGRSVAPTRDTSAKIARASSPTRLPPARDEADAPPVQVRRSLEERRLEERRSEERRDETQVAADTSTNAPATAAPASAEVKKVDSRRVTPRSAKIEAQPTGLNKFIR